MNNSTNLYFAVIILLLLSCKNTPTSHDNSMDSISYENQIDNLQDVQKETSISDDIDDDVDDNDITPNYEHAKITFIETNIQKDVVREGKNGILLSVKFNYKHFDTTDVLYYVVIDRGIQFLRDGEWADLYSPKSGEKVLLIAMSSFDVNDDLENTTWESFEEYDKLPLLEGEHEYRLIIDGRIGKESEIAEEVVAEPTVVHFKANGHQGNSDANSTNETVINNNVMTPHQQKCGVCSGSGKCQICFGSGSSYHGGRYNRCGGCSGTRQCYTCGGTGYSGTIYY